MPDTQEADDQPDPARFKPGTFGCHEALHMAHVLTEMVDTYLCSHPAIAANPAWKAQAHLAAETLANLYQAIGGQHGDAEDATAPEP